ncbi:MAG: methylated-DNA--[protein]-cysteine S-methyltransferase [Beutenbergiaceae bacterium]
MTERGAPVSHLGGDSQAERAALFPIENQELEVLRARLASRAAGQGLLDVAYRWVDSPVGTLLLAATPVGLVRVAFASEGVDAVLESLAQKVSPRIMHAPGPLDAVAQELEEYFARRRRTFEVPLDFTMSSGFRRSVQRYLPRISYGQTRSYREVAELVGNPKAVRAVGAACATNPLPVVVPCHRVLRSDGSLGGYIGGLDAKTTLLTLETE